MNLIPCLNCSLDGLSVFAATADQRALLGEDVFLRTHLPMNFLRYRPGLSPERWSEETLLERLGTTTGVARGNRIFLLYGAAGAGKSEALRWLQTQMGRSFPARQRAVIRIPRTALDPVRIVDTILCHFGQEGLGDQLHRWDALKKKPVALANQLIWGALGDMLDHDADIIPLSYKLRPIVEANLIEGIIAMENPAAATTPLQLITLEQLHEALHGTALSVPLEYGQLLARMREELDKALLGDVRLTPTLRHLSEVARETWGIRPILLVDDLVQSLNVYASDFLDYLLTLEEGDWDVVVGLTPASFEGSERTRELLQRINQLDTVDDRVTRLYLSDARGDDSSFLQLASLEQFTEGYLREMKRVHGFSCDASCRGFQTCMALQFGQRNDALLAPFNPAVLTRLFSRLPKGKGKPRYLLLAMAEVIRGVQGGLDAWLSQLHERTTRDQYAETSNLPLKMVAELFAPLQSDTNQLVIPPVLNHLLTNNQSAVNVTLHPLRAEDVPTPIEQVSPPPSTLDPDAEAVRDWLEGRPVNTELLKPLRRGTGRWLKDILDPARLSGHNSIRPVGVLRWSVQKNDCDLPILLEGVDEDDGIQVKRALGLVAFDLVRYHTLTGRGKDAALSRILDHGEAHNILLAAQRWTTTKLQELERTIQMPIDRLGHHLVGVIYALSFDVGSDSVPQCLRRLPGEVAPYVPGVTFTRREQQLAMGLWQDCFRIRDNVYRAVQIEALLRTVDLDSSAEVVLGVPANNIDYGFTIGSLRLGEFVLAIQERLGRLVHIQEHLRIQSQLKRFLLVVHLQRWVEQQNLVASIRRQVYQFNQLVRDLPAPLQQQLPDLTPPKVQHGPGPDNSRLISECHRILTTPKEVGPIHTLQVLSETLRELETPNSQAVWNWATRILNCVSVVRAWVDPREAGADPAELEDPIAALKEIHATLRRYRSVERIAESDSTLAATERTRWKERVAVLECLLPARSSIRRQLQPNVAGLKRGAGRGFNWPLLESTIRKAVRFWRTIELVGTALGAALKELAGLQKFLDAIELGKERSDEVADWAPRLAKGIRQVVPSPKKGENPIVMALAQSTAPLSIGRVSDKALFELQLYLPQVANRLFISAE